MSKHNTRKCAQNMQGFFVLKSFLQCFDQELKDKKISGDHAKKSAKEDLKKAIKSLQEENVFEKQEHRDPMSSFPDCPRDYLQLLDSKNVFSWINDHKQNVRLGKRPR